MERPPRAEAFWFLLMSITAADAAATLDAARGLQTPEALRHRGKELIFGAGGAEKEQQASSWRSPFTTINDMIVVISQVPYSPASRSRILVSSGRRY